MDVKILIRYMLVCGITRVTSTESASRTVEHANQKCHKNQNCHNYDNSGFMTFPVATVVLKGRRTKSKHTSKSDELFAIEENKTTQPCCYNGGIYIMNAFCHCKKSFYGRRCEHKQRHRSCGTIRHGTWMAVACHTCHCFDGKITCKTSTIRGCDNKSYTKGRETEPDYSVAIDKKFENFDHFYYDEDPAQLKSSSEPLRDSSSVIFILVSIFPSSVVNMGS